MSSSTVTVDAVVPNQTDIKKIRRYLSRHEGKRFHVESSVLVAPRAHAVLHFTSYSEDIDALIDFVKQRSELAGFDIFHDQVGEQEFFSYKDGKRLKASSDSFEKILDKALSRESFDGRPRAANETATRVEGTWICDLGESVCIWKFSDGKFSSTMGTEEEPSESYIVEGTYEIGESPVHMESCEDGWPNADCIPLTLNVNKFRDEYDYGISKGLLYMSCLFPKSSHKLWLAHCGSFELLADVPAPYGNEPAKPIPTYETDEEVIFLRAKSRRKQPQC